MLASCNILFVKFDSVWLGSHPCIVMNACHEGISVDNKNIQFWGLVNLRLTIVASSKIIFHASKKIYIG
jgi:hypothetical protein